MKYNYLFLHRPAKLCLAVLWLAILSNLALAQSGANVTSVRSGGPRIPAAKYATAPLVVGPDIAVSPAAVTDTLNIGKQITRQVTIQNTGTADLLFTAGIVPDFAVGGITKVLVVGPEEYVDGLWLAFDNAPDIQMSLFPRDQLPSLQLSDLLPYDVVIAFNNYPWGWGSGANEDDIGDVMADYIDAGGKIIMTGQAYATEYNGLGGRFAAEQYSPVLRSSVPSVGGSKTLGTVVRPAHPFIQGVTSMEFVTTHLLTLAPGGIDIAYANTGELLLATTPHVAVFNIVPSQSSYDFPAPWTGDVDIVFHNIVRYFKAAAVFTVTPVKSTVPPGGQINVNIAFDATGLDSAIYAAGFQVASNAPDTLVTVPVSLTVSGHEILFEPKTLSAALHKNESIAKTLTVFNNGTDSHSFTIASVPPFVTVAPLSGTLAVGDSAALTVTFSSAALAYGTYDSAIALNIDGTLWYAPVSLYVYNVPVVEVSTTFMDQILDYKDESVRILQIRNKGGSALAYSLETIGTNAASQPAAANASFVAGVPLLQEHFEGGTFPPPGWQTIGDPQGGQTWGLTKDFLSGVLSYYRNYAGTGDAAMMARLRTYPYQYNTQLITPEISTEGYRDFVLKFNLNYQEDPGTDTLTVDVQVDGGEWKSVRVWSNEPWGTHGAYASLPGEAVSIPLGDVIDSTASSFRIRWHHRTEWQAPDMNFYVQVDDVVILGEPRSWLNVSPISGNIPPGGSVDVAVNFDAEDHAPGAYDGTILVHTNDPGTPVVVIAASLVIRQPGELLLLPDAIIATTTAGSPLTASMAISNPGESALSYDFSKTGTIVPPSPQIVQYATGFDEYNYGDLAGQHGWSTLTAGWNIVGNGPGDTGKRIRYIAGDTDNTYAESPTVPVGSHDISSLRLDLSFVYRQMDFIISPAEASGQEVSAIWYRGASGSLDIYAYDSIAQGFIAHNVPLPPMQSDTGKLQLRVDANRAINRFTVYADGTPIFTGQGFTAQIQKVYILPVRQGTLYVDNFSISNGVEPEFFKTITPLSGNLPAGASALVAVTFTPTNTVTGIFRDTLIVTSSLGTVKNVPVHINVVSNAAPVLQPVDTLEATEHSAQTVVFKATDADNESVTISLKNAPGFVKPLSSGNGTATYKIAPKPADIGTYDVTVIATDARGQKDSLVWHLSVISYGTTQFAVRNAKTLTTYQTFTDSVVLDVASQEYSKIVIQADTKPATVGSVKFWWDNHSINVDDAAPYTLSPLVLPLATGGNHRLKTQAYTKRHAKGSKGTPREAVVRIINSSAVNAVNVVRANGTVLFPLQDGAVIDKRQLPNAINLQAVTAGSAIKSVAFVLNGAFHRVDNAAPYVLGGNWRGHDVPWYPAVGVYTLRVTPYALWYGLGVAGTSHTITFRIIDGAAPAARLAANDDIIPEETSGARFSLYPVPAADVLQIGLPAEEHGTVRVLIHDVHGRALFADQNEAAAFQGYTVSTQSIGLTKGFYYVQVRYANGRREIRKFLKE